MRKLGLVVGILATGAVAQSPSASPVSTDFTPRQLYVSCSLVLTEDQLVEERVLNKFKPIAPATCAGSILSALAVANDSNADPVFRFCANGSAGFDADILKSASLAYVEFYEANASRLNKVSGLSALFLALKDKWPCR